MPDIGSAYRGLEERPIIDNSGSVTITFPTVDLRPREPVDLDAVDLMIAEVEKGFLTATWTATSSDAYGIAEGTIEIPLHPKPIDLADLLPEP